MTQLYNPGGTKPAAFVKGLRLVTPVMFECGPSPLNAGISWNLKLFVKNVQGLSEKGQNSGNLKPVHTYAF